MFWGVLIRLVSLHLGAVVSLNAWRKTIIMIGFDSDPVKLTTFWLGCLRINSQRLYTPPILPSKIVGKSQGVMYWVCDMSHSIITRHERRANIVLVLVHMQVKGFTGNGALYHPQRAASMKYDVYSVFRVVRYQFLTMSFITDMKQNATKLDNQLELYKLWRFQMELLKALGMGF